MTKVYIEDVGGRETVFGPVTTQNLAGATLAEGTHRVTIEYDVSHDCLPETGESLRLKRIPAQSLIESATLYVEETWTGLTDLDIGLQQPDGTAIDADGIDATLAAAQLVAGAVIVCDGALIDGNVGANAAQVVMTQAGATAGKAKLRLTYVPRLGDVA